MRKAIVILLTLLVVLGLAGCQEAPVEEQKPTPVVEQKQDTPLPTPEPEAPLVGICLPGDQWMQVGQLIERDLRVLGYNTKLVYADHDASLQSRQIKELVEENPACLVVMPEDSVALLDALKAAKKANIPVVALDRMLMETDAVSGVVTFDYETFGYQMGTYLVENKQLDTALEENRSYTIEFFMGSTEDHSAFLLHKGLMQRLQPYLDAGVLVCKSGRTSFADTYVLHADQALAKRKCLELLQSAPQPDIICAASDVLAAGCAEAIREMGYEGDPMILLTGQGGDIEAVQRIVDGKQTMTIYKDWEDLASQCVAVVDALAKEEMPQWNDTESFDNHTIIVPAMVLPGVVVDKGNYKEKLVDTKIYSTDALPTK